MKDLKIYACEHNYEDFLQNFELPDNENSAKFYKNIKLSKEGQIAVEKLTDNPNPCISKNDVRMGYTYNFGEGLACFIETSDMWFHTSVIQKINWDNNTFDTLNSTYRFIFGQTKA